MKTWYECQSLHSPAARSVLLCSYRVLTSSVQSDQSTHALPNGIYLLIGPGGKYRFNDVNPVRVIAVSHKNRATPVEVKEILKTIALQSLIFVQAPAETKIFTKNFIPEKMKKTFLWVGCH